ncbi:hypothetical protein ACFWM1_20235 [Nocardia sp. NPDC058379]
MPSVVDRIISIAGLTAWLPVHAYVVDAMVAHTHTPARTPIR